MTTQHELIALRAARRARCRILRETALQIADPQVRYVGTLGGNVANGDPGNDMPAVMLCLGATYQVAGKGGERRDRGARVLPGRLFHRARAGRDPDRDPHSGAARRPRLRLREAQAQDRRLCHRRRRRRADASAAARSAACAIGLTNVGRDAALWPRRRRRSCVGSTLDAATVKRAVAAAEAITAPAADAPRARRSTAPRWPA